MYIRDCRATGNGLSEHPLVSSEIQLVPRLVVFASLKLLNPSFLIFLAQRWRTKLNLTILVT